MKPARGISREVADASHFNTTESPVQPPRENLTDSPPQTAILDPRPAPFFEKFGVSPRPSGSLG